MDIKNKKTASLTHGQWNEKYSCFQLINISKTKGREWTGEKQINVTI